MDDLNLLHYSSFCQHAKPFLIWIFILVKTNFFFSLSQEEGKQLARVTKILGRTGSRGGVTQVRVEFLGDVQRYVFLQIN